MSHEALVEKAIEAIKEVFGDTSVSKRETISSLKSLIDEIEIMVDALENDLMREAE